MDSRSLGARPLGPLGLELAEHLTKTLGDPTSHYITIQDGRDVYASGWTIGIGKVEGTPRGATTRGVDVEIVLTLGGTLITTRRSWTHGPDEQSGDQTGRAHPTPDAALQWLLRDGRGKLGPASKEAWQRACRAVPAMAALEFEVIE